MKEKTTRAQLCLNGPGDFVYVVATVSYTVREDETFRYELLPNYDVIALLDSDYYQGIPGFDLSRERPVYTRENMTPTLIADRAPMENREDLRALLDAYDMEYLDPVEWLIRSQKRYAGDRFYFRALPTASSQEPLDIDAVIGKAPSTHQAIKRILAAVCEGVVLYCDDGCIDRAGRLALYRTLLALYEKGRRSAKGTASNDASDAGSAGSASRASAPGRKRKPIDELMLREAVERYRAKQITAAEAAKSLDVGVATFYRRMAELHARQ